MNNETENYTKAKFWKCALQVNPFNYEQQYRGQDHQLSEDEYNSELLRVALKNEIKVIGIANHGDVSSIDKIRNLMNSQGIIVFPGFEIESSEKIHFVCLFSESTSVDALNRILGSVGMDDPKKMNEPSTCGGSEIIESVDKKEGFIFAAHGTDPKGILRQRANNIWKNSKLKAVQIPSDLETLKNNPINQPYLQILTNKNPDYQREKPIAIINANDVVEPADLASLSASCLIRMTKPCFKAFKEAFSDPESRIRLNYDRKQKYSSSILSLKIIGGYLDGLNIEFSEYLNAVIGGRGTGKSTLLECIRFVFDLPIVGDDARKTHDAIIRENVGRDKALVEVKISSSPMQGKIYTISRRYGERPIVKDQEGKVVSLSPLDLIPSLEIFGQNEIYEITQDIQKQTRLLNHFVNLEDNKYNASAKDLAKELEENRFGLIKAQKAIGEKEEYLNSLSLLAEQLKSYETLGIAKKLQVIPLLENEKGLLTRIEEEYRCINDAFSSLRDSLPDTQFLSDVAISNLPEADMLKDLRKELDNLTSVANSSIEQWDKSFQETYSKIKEKENDIREKISKQETALEQTFASIPESRGKSGKQIGIEYQRIVRETARIEPQKIELSSQQRFFDELWKRRKQLLAERSENKALLDASCNQEMKKLNKKLLGKLRVTYNAEGDKQSVIDYLVNCKLTNVAEGRLSWIKAVPDFNNIELSELVREKDIEKLKGKWSLTPSVANSLLELKFDQLLGLEEIDMPATVSIELNVAHGEGENYKSLDNLSKGQQCTAILNLLLIENSDPLLLDQPEDNLDNAFIADRIVSELRRNKLNRQFIFATHNANIPVFGDAEWIGVFTSTDKHGEMPVSQQGAIDSEGIKEMATNILEGGKAAFLQRKEKYGI